MDMLKVFEKVEFDRVRVVECEGEPWFVAKDVCECLELTNTSQTLSYLDDDEKGIISDDTPGGKQEMSIISEPGLYSLILRSRKPEAKAFKQWIIHEVVPSIRKRGLYATEAVLDRILDDPDFGISLLQQYNFEREQRKLVEAQRDDIGDSRTWKQVKAIPWLEEVFEVSQAMYSVAGRKLADMPRRMGYEIREVEDSRYGSVKAYHTDVIEAFQHALKADHNILWKYRRRCAAEGLPDMVKQPCSLVRRTGLLS